MNYITVVLIIRRYQFLDKDSRYQALNKLRAAFLAAKNAEEVEEILMGIFTADERMKIGRRIQIAEMIRNGFTYYEIKDELKVGPPTVNLVEKKMSEHPLCYELINSKADSINNTYKKSYRNSGGSKMIFKKREFVRVNKKDIKR